MSALFRFENSYEQLPERLFARVRPTPVRRPALVQINVALAETLGLDAARLATEEGLAVLAGNVVPEGSTPLALAYAGHQFGHFVPQLGDGRALLLGEIIGRDGLRRDLQLKGSGRTPFSRGGDGRAALGPVLREYVVAEAMHALGIPTTRALAAVTTGEPVQRERTLPGAVLARVAASHLRVGTFEHAAARGDHQALRALADHAIVRHDPEAGAAEQPYLALLEGVIARQARLVARWQLVGFVHGVMNTDNTTLSGETIDYGPCAFLDQYDPKAVWSSIDHGGRYAYGNQPSIMLWNLTRFAEALLPLLADDESRAIALAERALESFAPAFDDARSAGLRRKLGLVTARPGDDALGADLLAAMTSGKVDMTLAFRGLADLTEDGEPSPALRARFAGATGFDTWYPRWRNRLNEEPHPPGARAAGIRSENPAFIPRNHLVEEALAAATSHADFAPFHALVEVLARPFDEQPGRERYLLPPTDSERVTETFCGT